MENKPKNAGNPADMAIALIESLSNLNADVSFDFENMEVRLPGQANAPEPELKLNGTLRIRTKASKNQ